MKSFTVTPEHIKLIRNFYVGWQRCEFGAPEIDPKRPYGNSDVIGDIHEILGGKPLDYDDDEDYTDAQVDHYSKLHDETRMALQIVLRTGSFEPGTFVADDYSQNWKRIDD